MTTANANITRKLTLKQAADLIFACGSGNTFFLVGEPGIGKTALPKSLEPRLPDHLPAYLDCPNMDLGDIAMPVTDHETRTTRYYPNARFRMHEGKPVLLTLDEFTKAMEPVKNQLHPTIWERRLGDQTFHPDSIIILTGNLTSDGVGDTIKGHTLNRITRIEIAKPTADEWLMWAVDNGINPVVMAWVKQFPHCLASYTDGGEDDNPYIYNPKKFQLSYVSPRSLELASRIVDKRDQFDSASLIAALAGTIGEAAARDMEAFIAYQDELPTKEAIINSPTTAAVPTSSGACAVVTFGLINAVTTDSIDPIMEYISRLGEEWQAVFCINLAKNPKKQPIAFRSKAFTAWCTANADLL